jgi:preprotein translocase subunit YajC
MTLPILAAPTHRIESAAPDNAVFQRFVPAAAADAPPVQHKDRPVFISTAYAQTAPAPAAGGTESTLITLLPLVLMFVVLYFIMIRPQMKKQKEHKAMIDALAKGDEVVTAGGLLGKVSKLGESYVSIEAGNNELMVQRTAIIQVLPKGTIK